MPSNAPYILVVEDDRDICDGLVDLLDDHGRNSRVALNGKDALDILTAGPLPCLILLDLMMPVMSGHELIASLEALLPAGPPPICVMTAAPRFAVGLDVVAVIQKPFDEDALMAIVDRYCPAP